MDFLQGIFELISDLISAVPELISHFTSGISALGGGFPLLKALWVVMPSAYTSIIVGMISVSVFITVYMALLRKA